jgi:hypothetical protein
MCCFENAPLDPVVASEERFYATRELGMWVFGHTCDREMHERFRDEIEEVERARARGFEYGCWHSVIAPEGELGMHPRHALHEVAPEFFSALREIGFKMPVPERQQTYLVRLAHPALGVARRPSTPRRPSARPR